MSKLSFQYNKGYGVSLTDGIRVYAYIYSPAVRMLGKNNHIIQIYNKSSCFLLTREDFVRMVSEEIARREYEEFYYESNGESGNL